MVIINCSILEFNILITNSQKHARNKKLKI